MEAKVINGQNEEPSWIVFCNDKEDTVGIGKATALE